MSAHDRTGCCVQGEPTDHLPFSPFLAYVWESFPRAIQEQGQLAFHQRIGATPPGVVPPARYGRSCHHQR